MIKTIHRKSTGQRYTLAQTQASKELSAKVFIQIITLLIGGR